MEVMRFQEAKLKDLGRLCVTIGAFDGLHRAHQALIRLTEEKARETGAKSAVFTFDPHPDYVLGKRPDEGSLTPLPEKLTFFAGLGLDAVVIIPFDLTLACLTPEAFRAHVLGSFTIVALVVGEDFRYGAAGAGDASSLSVIAPTTIVPLMTYGDEKMGSEQVRRALARGDVEQASAILGHPYAVTGTVAQGSHIGRILGFPTANIALADDFQPLKEGVYVVKVTVDGKNYEGVANIGHNPTLNYVRFARLEVYLLDFSGDLYGKTLCVAFCCYLRGEQCFPDSASLHEQIKIDARLARAYFGGEA